MCLMRSDSEAKLRDNSSGRSLSRTLSSAKVWISRAIRLAKALAFDPRFPRPLRWAVRVALAIKCVPFPDFGVDEVMLLAVGAILWIFYRPQLLAVLEETK